MRDPRPDIPDSGQGLLAAVVFTTAGIYEAGFSLGTGVVFVSRRERQQDSAA